MISCKLAQCNFMQVGIVRVYANALPHRSINSSRYHAAGQSDAASAARKRTRAMRVGKAPANTLPPTTLSNRAYGAVSYSATPYALLVSERIRRALAIPREQADVLPLLGKSNSIERTAGRSGAMRRPRAGKLAPARS